MALVLILSGLVTGFAAALGALMVGAGFLAVTGAYLGFGATGAALTALWLWSCALRRPAAPRPDAGWGLPAP